MDVSIIIVNYNTKQVTQSCINSIVEHSHGFSYEIILVDNHSTDGSYALFSNDARIKYVYNEKNVGFGQANNIDINIQQEILYFIEFRYAIIE